MAVFVLDNRKRPLMPCSEKRARRLLERGRAVVARRYPFTIRLKDRLGGNTPPLRLSLDPGSRETGMAVSRECAYCGVTDTPLEVEHIVSRRRGGSDRIGNLTLACHACNQEKGTESLDAFFATGKGLSKRLTRHGHRADARLARVQHQRSQPLRDASAVNATRWALYRALQATGLPVEAGSGGRTKFNRQRLGLPKTHALDAACVGPFESLQGWQVPTLAIKAMGRGSYQRTRLNRYGFPRGYLMRQKPVHGFQTGDRVKAVVPTGKQAGVHIGRVAVRQTGSFNIQTEHGAVQGISHRHCTTLQRGDGYRYHQTLFTDEQGGGRTVA